MMRAHRLSHARWLLAALLGASSVAAIATPAVAREGDPARRPREERSLDHVGTFYVDDNLGAGEPTATPTSAEILDVSDDGRTLVYTDALTGRLGIVDVRDPAQPEAAGTIDLPGGPTSVAIFGRLALVTVVTSEDPDGPGPLNEFDAPSGELLVINLRTRQTVRSLELAGQPDAIAIAPSERFAAIVIENERDDDENDGLIPQPPPGTLEVLDLRRPVRQWSLETVELTGLADVAPSDPEPEYVDINRRDQAVVSLQENNHLVIVDLRRHVCSPTSPQAPSTSTMSTRPRRSSGRRETV